MTPSRDDLTLLRDFEAGTIPLEAWTHEAHVRVAWLYLGRLGAGALDRMRAGLQALLVAKGIDPGRYNETVTACYLRLIQAAMARHPGDNWEEFRQAHPGMFDREHPPTLRHYRKETLLSDEAKARFVEPDLEPLPALETTARLL